MMIDVDRTGSFLGLTGVAATLAFVFYPMTLAPLGPWTNGGVLGIGSLLLATIAAWSGFGLNKSRPVARIAVQLPITALITFMAIREAVIQYQIGPGRWLWF